MLRRSQPTPRPNQLCDGATRRPAIHPNLSRARAPRSPDERLHRRQAGTPSISPGAQQLGQNFLSSRPPCPTRRTLVRGPSTNPPSHKPRAAGRESETTAQAAGTQVHAPWRTAFRAEFLVRSVRFPPKKHALAQQARTKASYVGVKKKINTDLPYLFSYIFLDTDTNMNILDINNIKYKYESKRIRS